ncbi:hypothetical protein A7A08_01011 [Methyloligella halotolerans]|uniref:Uncharacterized protein n=1 Tax=Methyloligella halotolerans TaxID=1177755 RepID=A0A1E2S044_9HYPH|nr:hypothetical protein [Methyloligella halotolerans]ODA67844.1 hypothetical protein A7A08_01011 [Methyloligella halotolerans]
MANLRGGIVAGIAILGVAALLFAWWWSDGGESLSSALPDGGGKVAAGPPQLNCVFYKFVASRPHLEFVFNVEGDAAAPRFEQLYTSLFNGTERTVDVKEPPYPVWKFDAETEPKRIYTEIDVPDHSLQGKHSEPVAIQLYQYDPASTGPGWMEASLKSVHFQNLPGQCRQSIGDGPPAE